MKRTIAALVQALDDPAHIPSAELERLAHSVLQYGRGMPEGIQHRYVARLRSAEARQARRRRVLVAGAAAGLLLAGSLSFYLIRSWARSSDASQAASTILDMIELGQIEQASGFLEKLQKADAGLLSYPPMIEARQKFQVIQDKETERVLQFDKTIRAAEQRARQSAQSARAGGRPQAGETAESRSMPSNSLSSGARPRWRPSRPRTGKKWAPASTPWAERLPRSSKRWQPWCLARPMIPRSWAPWPKRGGSSPDLGPQLPYVERKPPEPGDRSWATD